MTRRRLDRLGTLAALIALGAFFYLLLFQAGAPAHSATIPTSKGITSWTASRGSSAQPATKTVFWATTNDPAGPMPSTSTVHWPQTLYPLDPGSCGASVWLQRDVYSYSGSAKSVVDTLLAKGVLRQHADSAVIRSWSFVLVVPCPAPSSSATSPSTAPSSPSEGGTTSSTSDSPSGAPSTSSASQPPTSTAPPATPTGSSSTTTLSPPTASHGILRPRWITGTKSSCDQLTVTFNLPTAIGFQLVDTNAGHKGVPLGFIQAAGRSTFVYHLPTKARVGTSDSVQIEARTSPLPALLSTVSVPVNCAIAPAQSITHTPDAGTPQITAVPASSNTNLANTGVPVWMVWALALAVIALVLGTVFVLFGGPHRRHAGSPPS